MQQETKKKVNMLGEVKKKLASRFLKVYRLFRHKKYGEPIEAPKSKIKEEMKKGEILTEDDIQDIKKSKKRRGS